MPKKTEAKKFIYKPATKEIFLSLASMPSWCEILLAQKPAPYSAFLKWLIANDRLKWGRDTSIKNIAKDFGIDAPKAAKRIAQIYDAPLELNEDSPNLFKAEGIRHDLHFRYLDSGAFVTVWLSCTPRMHERLSFRFVNAQLGISFFYVNEVEHIINKGEHTVSISLIGGLVNRYRESLVERAEFEGMITFSDSMDPFSRDMDTKLRIWYK